MTINDRITRTYYSEMNKILVYISNISFCNEVELQKCVLICVLPGIMEKSPYKWGSLAYCNVKNRYKICWTFQKCVRTTTPPVLIHILLNKNLNVNNFDTINCNEISTYDQIYDSHGELTVKFSMVITK